MCQKSGAAARKKAPREEKTFFFCCKTVRAESFKHNFEEQKTTAAANNHSKDGDQTHEKASCAVQAGHDKNKNAIRWLAWIDSFYAHDKLRALKGGITTFLAIPG